MDRALGDTNGEMARLRWLVIEDCASERTVASHFLSVGWICVFTILFTRMCLGIVCEALLMSITHTRVS